MTNDKTIDELRGRDAGDDEAVYEDIDRETLPDWWQQAAAEHETYGLRPYRPPRFEDGTIVPSLIEDLESTYEIDIKLLGVNALYGDAWSVYIDGEAAFEIDRHRDPDGYTVFEESSQKFTQLIEETVTE